MGCVGGVRKGGAFCSVCIFHNQKMHVYLISEAVGKVNLGTEADAKDTNKLDHDGSDVQ